MILTVLLVRGIRESAESQQHHGRPSRLAPFSFSWSSAAHWSIPATGILSRPPDSAASLPAALIVFFTYIGFDSVSTAAEEARNPQRDLPIGIIASLIVCTVLYVGVSLVLLGMMRYTSFVSGEAAEATVRPVALKVLGASRWSRSVIVIGALTGMLSSLLVFQYRPGAHLVRHVPRRTLPQASSPEFIPGSRLRTGPRGLRVSPSGFRAGLMARRMPPISPTSARCSLCAGLARRDHLALHPARAQAHLQSALRAVDFRADLHHPLRRPHDRTYRHHLGTLLRMAGARPSDLLSSTAATAASSPRSSE